MPDQVKWWFNAKGLSENVRRAYVQRIKRCGAIVMREAKLSMKKGGQIGGGRGRDKATGRFIKGRKRRGIPSPVGTPPHVQTGTLRASILAEMTPQDTVLVGPTSLASYGAVHEFSKKFPRKFMRPALFRAKGQFAAEFKDLPIAAPAKGTPR